MTSSRRWQLYWCCCYSLCSDLLGEFVHLPSCPNLEDQQFHCARHCCLWERQRYIFIFPFLDLQIVPLLWKKRCPVVSLDLLCLSICWVRSMWQSMFFPTVCCLRQFSVQFYQFWPSVCQIDLLLCQCLHTTANFEHFLAMYFNSSY